MPRLVFGSCTWPHGSTRINSYVVGIGTDGKTRRMAPRSRLHHTGQATRQEAGRDGGHGYWSTLDYEPLEGAIVLVQLSTSKHGSPWCDAAVALRLREDADFVQVTAHTIVANGNLTPHINVFQGRADVLTPREANQFGACLDLNYIEAFFKQDEVEEAFSVRTLYAGTAEKPTIKKRKIRGETKMVVESNRKRRRIKLRRKPVDKKT